MFKGLMGALGLAIGLLAFGGTAAADFDMSCESVGGNYRYCSVDARRGVALIQQKSNAPCIYQTTWGFDSGGVWVNLGCRGVFRVKTGGGGSSNDKVDDLLPYGVVNNLEDQDDYDGRGYPYGRADALRMCAKAAQAYEIQKGGRVRAIDNVTVDVRGQRSYAIRFQVEGRYKKNPKLRYYFAKCGVKGGEVQSFGRD